MTISVIGTYDINSTSGTNVSYTFGPALDVLDGDLIVICAAAEGSSTLSIDSVGWTLAGVDTVAHHSLGDLCTMYVWYKEATYNWGSTESAAFTSSDTLMGKKFINHHIRTTKAWGGDAVTATMGTDNTPAPPSPGMPPDFDIGPITLASFDDALLRVAICNDNGDEGTFDAAQTFSGHTRLTIMTGDEVGMISIQKDSVAAGLVPALTLNTISVVGGVVDGIVSANIGLRDDAGGSSNMMLLGVG